MIGAACLEIGSSDTIPTDCAATVGEAVIAIDLVAVVTFLRTIDTRFEVDSGDAVAASSDLARGRTGIVVLLVAVVAVFIGLLQGIATAGGLAQRRAFILIVLVAVIAQLIQLNDSITTTRVDA